MVARDWSTQEDCQLSINYEYNQAQAFYEEAWSTYGAFKASIGTETDPVTRAIFTKARYVFDNLIKVVYRLIIENSDYTPSYAVPYFLKHYAGGVEYELTWEKIVAAWADADITGRIFTVASIDFMRQEIWNEPVTSFALAPGGLGG